MIQGGDFTKRNGTGGESIYGHSFEDENFDRDVDAEGLLVMANRGPNTNSSQFFITVRPCPHLNGKHVVFGRVVAGLDIVKQISKLPVDEKSRPLKPVVIASCGELELRKAPPKPREPTPESRSASATPSDDSDDDRRRSKKHKSKRRSSRSPDASKSKSKSKKHKSRRDEEEGDGLERKDFGGPRKETEEEYDARLEREEKERIEEKKRAELEDKRRKLEREQEREERASGGVRYKGRGQMKYRESDHRPLSLADRIQ
ncbi:hypothetical protein FRC08_011066 [Ceratobasidium sp. 394]|nr:hypothetical protein FRC08_011066 [Ceratobasidium sp. 394]